VRSQPPTSQFRTIQVCPKDWPSALRQAERAPNRLPRRSPTGMIGGGTLGREPHVWHEAARVHHAARRRSSGVAASGACAGAHAADRRAPGLSRGRCGNPGPHRGVPAGPASNWAGPTVATCGSTLSWATTNADDIRRHAAELAALAPDVILAATGTVTVAPLLQATRTVPIVFVTVHRPGRRRFRRQPGPARRQRDWVHGFSNTA